jgi:hypothetical protein
MRERLTRVAGPVLRPFFEEICLDLSEATGFGGAIVITDDLNVLGRYCPSLRCIKVHPSEFDNPARLTHLLAHEFGHYVAEQAFLRLGRPQSSLSAIPAQARERILLALGPQLARRPVKLRYYRKVRGGKSAAEFAAELIACYLLAHVVDGEVYRSSQEILSSPWATLPGLVYTEDFGFGRRYPAGSRLLEALQRQVERLVIPLRAQLAA